MSVYLLNISPVINFLPVKTENIYNAFILNCLQDN